MRLFENPEDGKFLALPWDLDRSFQLAVGDTLWGTFGSLSKLFDLPQVSRLFYGHADDIINNFYTAEYTSIWVNHYGEVANRNFTSHSNYVQTRSDILLSRLPGLADFEITTNGGNAISVGSNQAVLVGTGSYKIREIQIDGFIDPLEVTWVDDTTWQVLVNVNPGENELTFRAIDFSGNEIHSDVISVTSTDGSALPSDYLRISEIHYHPADPTPIELAANPGLGDNNFEFVELINTSTAQSLNLEGVQFVEQVLDNDNQGITFTFGALTLAPGERIVVVEDTEAFQLRYGNTIQIAGEFSGNLDNGGETITLHDATGQTIEQFEYGDTVPWADADGSGQSLNRNDFTADGNLAASWIGATPTPGTEFVSTFEVGDVDMNGIINILDISPFIGLLSTGGYQFEADTNGDGLINILDLSLIHI